MTPKNFRILLAGSMLFGLLSIFYDLLLPFSAGELGSGYQAKEFPLVVEILSFIVVIGSIIAFVGLYVFRHWAPMLALISTAAAILLTPAFGFEVLSGWAAAFSELSTLLWGAVLAAVFFSPLKERFHAKR